MKDNGAPFSIGSDVWPGLAKLVEEMGELTQLLMKVVAVGGELQHWEGPLRGRLIEEFGDVVAAMGYFTEHNEDRVPFELIEARADVKMAKFNHWHEKYQASGS